MKLRCVIFCLTFVTVLLAQPATAITVSVPCQMSGRSGNIVAVQNTFKTDAVAITIRENEAIVFAEFSFHDDLPVGTEIEIWPQIEGETPPWDLSEEDFPFQRNFWITDERTGSLVRYDVTSIVRAWAAGSLQDLGFMLRIRSEIEASEQSQDASPIKFSTPKEAVLTYYIMPVREPKETQPRHREEEPSGQTPQNEDNSGRSD